MLRKVLAIALGAVLLSGAALAQTYPTRAITMIIPFAAGGPTDTVGRLIAEAMGVFFIAQAMPDVAPMAHGKRCRAAGIHYFTITEGIPLIEPSDLSKIADEGTLNTQNLFYGKLRELLAALPRRRRFLEMQHLKHVYR